MNAKKIMGAVLVALLAAALFVGAGAAAETNDYGAVFVYQNQSDLAAGLWTNGDATITIGQNGAVVAATNFVPGTYKNASGTLYVGYPAATISGIAGNGAAAYPFIGANLFDDDKVTITNTSVAVAPIAYLLTFPNTTTITVDQDKINATVEELGKGTYKLAVKFNNSDFVLGTDVKLLQTAPVSFTIVDADDATITASVNKMIKGETFTITVVGQPGIQYLVNATPGAFYVTPNQPGIDLDFSSGNVTINMSNSGIASFTLQGMSTFDEEEATLELWWMNTGVLNETGESVTIEFAKGTITAKTEKASYFVGDEVKVIVTSTAGDLASTFKINGTNFYATPSLSAGDSDGDTVKTIEFTFDTSDIYNLIDTNNKKMDVGTYTLTLSAAGDSEVTATVPLTLKQPFISIAEAPEVIVQGEDAEFILNAEATDMIGYYIFGTNYFASFGGTGVKKHPEDEEGEDIKNQFIVDLGESVTEKMAAGQYFAVFQHPMYDGQFNITATGWIIHNNPDSPVVEINVKDRQTANAAQALCDALDMQGIDDMYAKASFFIVGKDQSFTISEIPTTIAQGETLTISGVSTANADETVTVEMISTAFAAVPKENVGSAAFIVVTTTVADDGTWEVTLDTSDLNVDEYSLKVACGDDTWKNVKINVVEGAETPDTPDTPDVPDTPDTPDTPTEPTTPGFGALAALAGLGAVAVLLLRRE